ncbi:hypothetical protein SAMN05660909_01488 [Chitinophaga terrae (ex Kim and Jung 2007)]|uniref:Uncharacterized protein n=1 Tax=Chitinophaga terrae (ex Kim and Jung 2007) TaxID=408074 RepID=A0A1H4A6W7_9BACT|nr:hypothetical protein [Chitinophaga terrae (ex Kim and Jung 2007)]SEA31322.1 hypothetical protein SAMN05660909_01488 [Chitinophaga terrae (ex Kim and Jung 2007)]
MLRSLLLLCAICITFATMAQKPYLVRIVGSYDSTAVTELYNSTPIGIRFVYSDSSILQTTGYLQGNTRWNKLNVSSSNGSIQNGVLQFNRTQLVKDNYRITLTVNTEENHQFQTTLQFPQVIGIRFNLYTDSIKRNIHYYLNVEGKFSSGKVYPLDTSALRFAASDGQILGQDLLLPLQDTVKTVTVEAWYKPNSKYYIRAQVPVKQAPDNDSLLTNPNDLFKKKRRN